MYGRRPSALVFFAAVWGLFLTGCKEPETITRYRVPTPDQPPPSARMLAAIVPHGDQAWFFKTVGPVAPIADAKPAFLTFLQSLEFSADGQPKWELPADWKPDPSARGLGRFATLRIPAAASLPKAGNPAADLELAVSSLPVPTERRDDLLLQNINRWRKQMGQEALFKTELPRETTSLPLPKASVSALVVDFSGEFNGGPALGPATAGVPTAGAPTADPALRPSSAVQPPPAATELPFTATVPPEWRPGKAGGFRVAAYEVGDASQRAEMTVIPLGPSSGDLASNMQRWQGELNAPPTSVEEAKKDGLLKTLPVEGAPADYLVLHSPPGTTSPQATLGVILRRPDRVWYFKLKGAAELVDRERGRFEDYVRSVKFKS